MLDSLTIIAIGEGVILCVIFVEVIGRLERIEQAIRQQQRPEIPSPPSPPKPKSSWERFSQDPLAWMARKLIATFKPTASKARHEERQQPEKPEKPTTPFYREGNGLVCSGCGQPAEIRKEAGDRFACCPRCGRRAKILR